MKCLLCGSWGLKFICKNCLNEIPLRPKVREIENLHVYSFFAWSDVEELMSAKYYRLGCHIYRALGRKAGDFLAKISAQKLNALALGIDERVDRGYSHNAIFVRELVRSNIGLSAAFGALKAQNKVNYAGKSLQFRKENPRNFTLKKHLKPQSVVLIDDIITTGTTLKEAQNFLQNRGFTILCAFCLSDADS